MESPRLVWGASIDKKKNGNSSPCYIYTQKFLNWAAITALILLGHALLSSGNAKEKFTIKSSIEAPAIMYFVDGPNRSNRQAALFSPSKSKFILQTRHGDLATKELVDNFYLFSVSTQEDLENGAALVKTVRPKHILEWRASDVSLAPTSIRWTTECKIEFVGAQNSDKAQAYELNTCDGILTQRTNSNTAVGAFVSAGDTLLYFADMPQEPEPSAIVVEDQTWLEVLRGEASYLFPARKELFAVSPADGTPKKMNLPPFVWEATGLSLWISPNGRYAITLVPIAKTPTYWSEYEPFSEAYRYPSNGIRSAEIDEALGIDLSGRDRQIALMRYVLLDLKKGTTRNLLDAPVGVIAGDLSPRKIFWSADSNKVIATNVFLPIADTSGIEREERRTRTATVSVDLGSNAVTRVFWQHSTVADKISTPVEEFEWSSETKELTIIRKNADNSMQKEVFRNEGKNWIRVSTAHLAIDEIFVVQVKEGLNSRPKVFATKGARSEMIFDPAPDLDNLIFGRVEDYSWTDGEVRWKGGLVYPTDFDPSKPYPLIVQTHGYDENVFIINGPPSRLYGASAYAAQAFANAGMFVLQVEDKKFAESEVASRTASGYYAAISALVSSGLVDKTRVGMIAWSATGLSVIQFLTDYPSVVSAATLADSGWWSYFKYLRTPSSINSVAVDYSWLFVGGKPSAGNIGEWFARNPLYKLPSTGAAIRIEEYGPSRSLSQWEHFAVLRNANHAVDYILLPHGKHTLQKPFERLVSQQGNVDWFRFWLQDFEDPAPEKVEQYERWRKLRILQCQNANAPRDYCRD